MISSPSRWLFATCAVAGLILSAAMAEGAPPQKAAPRAKAQAGKQGNNQNGLAGNQGSNQNGKNGQQGDNQNGQAGQQGHQQNGQAANGGKKAAPLRIVNRIRARAGR
jgi:hypothetical protein